MRSSNSSTVKMTISVPRELKAQMDMAIEPIDWSALACGAFQKKADEILARKLASERGDAQLDGTPYLVRIRPF